jgi:hypothetical protein
MQLIFVAMIYISLCNEEYARTVQEVEDDETCIGGSKPGKLGCGADGNWLFEKLK